MYKYLLRTVWLDPVNFYLSFFYSPSKHKNRTIINVYGVAHTHKQVYFIKIIHRFTLSNIGQTQKKHFI